MAKQMSPHRRCLDARPLYGTTDQTRDGAAGTEMSKRRTDFQEYMIVLNGRAKMLKVM
jgi:hypothetical protein